MQIGTDRNRPSVTRFSPAYALVSHLVQVVDIIQSTLGESINQYYYDAHINFLDFSLCVSSVGALVFSPLSSSCFSPCFPARLSLFCTNSSSVNFPQISFNSRIQIFLQSQTLLLAFNKYSDLPPIRRGYFLSISPFASTSHKTRQAIGPQL